MKRFAALLLPLCLAVENSAQAVQPPPADTRCSVSLGSHTVDYGALSRWQLRDSEAGSRHVTFGKRTLMLSVICPSSQPLVLRLNGERSAKGDLRYGERGWLAIRVLEANLDGKSVQVVSSRPDGVIEGAASDSLTLQPGQVFAPGVNGQVAKGQSFTARVEIEPMLSAEAARVGSLTTSEARFNLQLVR